MTEAASGSAGVTSGGRTEQVLGPVLVPLHRRDALFSALMIAFVLGFLGVFLVYLYSLWLPQGIPQQVVYLLILGMTGITALLFVWSLLVFVVPRSLGLRGPPVPRASGKD